MDIVIRIGCLYNHNSSKQNLCVVSVISTSTVSNWSLYEYFDVVLSAVQL